MLLILLALVDQLLAYPPPRPRPAAAAQMRVITGDEPIDALASLALSKPERITPAARKHVAERLAQEPEILPGAILVVPQDKEGAAVAWAAFNKLTPEQRKSEGLQKTREWLRRHGDYLRDDLLRALKDVRDDDGGWVRASEDLEALAKLDWQQAQPILERLTKNPGPRTAAFAHALLYAHSHSESERAALKKIAEDRTTAGHARDYAIEALVRSEWEGRDAWYRSLFSDPTLILVSDGMYGLQPLSASDADPDYWIPVLAELTKSSDKTIRSNAVNLLAEYNLEAARADALRPLLPWLAHPKWAQEASMGRLRFVQSVGGIGLREAIPGLQWICEHDDDTMREYAAVSLLELHAPGAMAIAMKVLPHVDSPAELEMAIVDSGDLDDESIAKQIAAQTNLGKRLTVQLPERESLAQKLLAHADQKMVARAVSQMNLPSVHRWLATRLVEPEVDPYLVYSLLEHRADAAKNASAELQSALKSAGAASGIAAIVLDDDSAIHAILTNGTPEARMGLFAAARLTRRAIAAEEIVRASNDAKPAAAALLATLNTAASRQALGTLYPGEARIWGERPWEDPGHVTFKFFDEWEERLRAQLRSGHYDRIDAVVAASYWGRSRELVAIAQKGDRVVLLPNTTLAPPSVATLRAAMAELHPDDLPLFDGGAYDGVQYEYVSLTRDGGHRLFMNNPPEDPRDPYARLIATLAGVR